MAAVADPFHGLAQRQGQARATAAITLEQLQRHALGGFLTDTRQGSQGIDQLANQRAEAHGETSDKTTRRGLYPRLSFSVKYSVLRDPHHQFAEVASFQQTDERLGGVFQTVDHVFAEFHLAIAAPTAPWR